jgi:general secretion pathway protein M
MTNAAVLRARWDALVPRERMLVAGAVTLVVLLLAWFVLLSPALVTLRSAATERTALDAQLQRMLGLQAQAQQMQSQPKLSHDEAARQLETSVRQRLAATGRVAVTGDRATVTLTGTPPDVLAQWLAQARANAHVLPAEAHLNRNASSQWEGSLVLTLPPR